MAALGGVAVITADSATHPGSGLAVIRFLGQPALFLFHCSGRVSPAGQLELVVLGLILPNANALVFD